MQSLSIETSTLYLHTPSWQWDSGTTRQTGLLTMNNPHSACQRNTLMRECGIFGGIFVCDCKSGPRQQTILIFGHISPHCRSRDHPLDFPTTSWHLSRLVALITPHEFGEVSSSAIFDLELGVFPIRSIRASAAEMCSHRLRVFFNRIAVPPAQLSALSHTSDMEIALPRVSFYA